MWQKMLQIGSGSTPSVQPLYIFKKGEGVPSDWNFHTNTNTRGSNATADRIYLQSTASAGYNNSGVYCKNPIKTKGYTKLYVSYKFNIDASAYYTDNYTNIIGLSTYNDNTKYEVKSNYVLSYTNHTLGTNINYLDISSVDQDTYYYVGAGGTIDIEIYDIWLEP